MATLIDRENPIPRPETDRSLGPFAGMTGEPV
jgi:hypothetical protein